MSDGDVHTGNVQPGLDLEEHNHAAEAKNVVPLALQEDGQYGGALSIPRAGTNNLYTGISVSADTATLLANASTVRRLLTISNLHTANTMWMGPDNTVTETKGIPVKAEESLIDSGVHLTSTTWYGYCKVAVVVNVSGWDE